MHLKLVEGSTFEIYSNKDIEFLPKMHNEIVQTLCQLLLFLRIFFVHCKVSDRRLLLITIFIMKFRLSVPH